MAVCRPEERGSSAFTSRKARDKWQQVLCAIRARVQVCACVCLSVSSPMATSDVKMARNRAAVAWAASSSLKLYLSASALLLGLCLGEHSEVPPIHKHLCLEDDYTNDLPIFIERRTICNFESVPIHVYTIKTSPDSSENKYCLKGECAEKFKITDDKEIKLYDRLAQPETNLRLQIIRTSNDIVGTPTERRQAINAVQFNLNIEECNQVSWQTIVVAILSSVCVALMSSLAIMLILYQQKGLIGGRNSGDQDERSSAAFASGSGPRDESFINPRRTSSYEFSTMSRHSASTLERGQETTTTSENL